MRRKRGGMPGTLRTRTIAAALVAAAGLAVGYATAGMLPAHAPVSPLPASTARYAAAASSYQNKVISLTMTERPGGTRISADAVRWPDGITLFVPTSAHARVTLTDASATLATGHCLLGSGVFCAFSKPDYAGCEVDMATGPDDLVWFDWAAYSGTNCGGAGTWSWDNDSAYRVWREQVYSRDTSHYAEGSYFYAYGGTDNSVNSCISPEAADSDVTNTTDRTLGWIQTTSNTAAC
jgi:hypothetical protein